MSWVANSSITVDDMRFHLAAAQSSVSSAAIESLRGERGQYLNLLRSSVGQFDRLENDFTNVPTSTRDTRSTLRRGLSSIRDEFSTVLENKTFLKMFSNFPRLSIFL